MADNDQNDQNGTELPEGPGDLPNMREEDRGTADVDMGARGAGRPSWSVIRDALSREALREPTFVFAPAGTNPQGAPLPPNSAWGVQADNGFTVDYATPPSPDDRPKDDQFAGLRDQISDLLPVMGLLMSWHRMYHTRDQRAELDRQLDRLGYGPVEYTQGRTHQRVQDEDRQAIYDALAGVL